MLARKGMLAPDPGALYLKDDQPVNLKKYRGRPLVILFFSNACCADELEKFETIVKSNKNQYFQVLGINVGEGKEEVQLIGKEKKISFPLAYDPLLTSKHRFRLIAIPTIVIVDQRGRILGRILGDASYEMLTTKIFNKIKG